MARVAQDDPDELPMDQITQVEIACLLFTEKTKDTLAISFKRRIENGASIEPGPYFLKPDGDSLEDLLDAYDPHICNEFNCIGFSAVGWTDPAKAEPAAVPAPTSPAQSAGRSAKQGSRKLAKRGGGKK